MDYDGYTLGFSNRSWNDTLSILQAFQVRRLIDIRTLPGSRRTPQFNLEALERSLPQSDIEYIHMKSLGGLRKPLKGAETNAAWQNDGFRGYADYMQTPPFAAALSELIRFMGETATVFCCTEAVFWRCHRQLVADALTIRGYRIAHIFSATKAEPHHLTRFARTDGAKLTYPGLLA
jgi:uncharacterized protein (DUF488 family)